MPRERLVSASPPRRRLAVVAAAALAASVACIPSPAFANGRYPQAGQAVVAPSNAAHIYLRTTFGILVSKDGGATWDWICETAYGDTTNYDAMMGITSAERILVTLPTGLWSSPDGCNWGPVAGIGTHAVTDLVVRKDDASAALAVTSDFAGTDAGVSTFTSRVYASADDGVTWAAIGAPVSPPVLIATIEVAASDPQRIYLSGTRNSIGASGVEEMAITSHDMGATWTQADVPALQGDLGAYLAGVDPTNADRVYVRTQNTTSGTTTGRLLVSSDGAATFQQAYSGGALLGFALSADGGEVFVGGLWPSDGLQAAPSGTLAFAERAELSVECLTLSGAVLYSCGYAYNGFAFGASRDDGVTFAASLDFRTIRGPLACATGTATAACAAEWPALVAQLGIGTVVDGGIAAEDAGAAAPDASRGTESDDAGSSAAGDAATPGDRRAGAGGCGAANGTNGAPMAGAVALLAALATSWRRRARTRKRR